MRGRRVRDDAQMAERLHRFTVPDGQQTVRIEFPGGQTFRLGMRDGGIVRFAVETDRDVRMVEFYGRGGNAIVGLQITTDVSEATQDDAN
jgi:hypothetical protein